MLQTIDIPSPSGADADNVVTALETAAIFGAKGDAHEAMRWLRRAAEAAGAAGDDERALSLSRLAADLHDELSGTQPIQSPTPPPSASVSYPPPPSSRSARPPSVVPRPSQVPRPSSRPASVAASRPPLALVPSQPVAEPAAVEAVAAPPAPPPLPEVTPAPAPMLEAPPPVAAALAPALPAVSTPLPLAPELAPPPTSLRSTTSSTGARHAARVQVAISTSKVGYLEVRLLAEGEAPRLGASEALLVMLDPASTLLAR